MTGQQPVPVKVGILSFAHPHAIDYAQLLMAYTGVSVRATDPGPHPQGEVRGSVLAEQLGVPYSASLEELMDWQPDAVLVTSENSQHRRLVEFAASRGVHILCEKPLATTWEDATAISRVVEETGVAFAVAFPMRFAGIFRRLRTDYDAGLFGSAVAVRASNNGKLPSGRVWFTEPSLSGGGALVDHVVHAADLIQALLPRSAPVSVTAVANEILHRGAGVETAGLVTVAYDDGLIATIDCSWSRPETAATWGGLTLHLLGTAGTAETDFFGPRVRGISSSSGLPIELPYSADYNDAMLRSFIDSVRSGAAPQPGVEAGLKTLQIVLAAQRSVRTGATVHLSPAAQSSDEGV